MDKKTEKEKLLALIEAKKKGGSFLNNDRKNIYQKDGERRKGIKQHKQGGLFDK